MARRKSSGTHRVSRNVREAKTHFSAYEFQPSLVRSRLRGNLGWGVIGGRAKPAPLNSRRSRTAAFVRFPISKRRASSRAGWTGLPLSLEVGRKVVRSRRAALTCKEIADRPSDRQWFSAGRGGRVSRKQWAISRKERLRKCQS